MSGWVKLPRSTENHPTLRNATRRGLFDRLYLMAARQPTRRDWRGTTVVLDVAQVVISVREFAEQNDVGYKEARNHLARLQRDRLIEIGTVKGAVRGAKEGAIGTIVTICLDELFSTSDEIRGAGRGAVNGAVRGAIGAQEGRNRGAPVRETLEKGETLEANHEDSESLTHGPPPPDGGAAEPTRAAGIRSTLWSQGEALLGKGSRSLIGELIRDYGRGQVLDVLMDCERECPAQPRAWVVGALKTRCGGKADRSPMASHKRVMAILNGEQPPPTASEQRALAMFYADPGEETIQ